MEYLEAIAMFVVVLTSFLLGKGSADGEIFTVKRENERLNAELHRLTDRDERGRFKGGK